MHDTKVGERIVHFLNLCHSMPLFYFRLFYSKQSHTCSIKYCRCLDLNSRPLVSEVEATALPTELQPQPRNVHFLHTRSVVTSSTKTYLGRQVGIILKTLINQTYTCLFLTNQSALFQHSIAMLNKNLFMTPTLSNIIVLIFIYLVI